MNAKPRYSYKYKATETRQGKLYYQKNCLHCKSPFQGIKINATFCSERCRKASLRKIKAEKV